jgi:hypothetical protein
VFLRDGNNFLAVVKTTSKAVFKEDVGANKTNLTEIYCTFRDYNPKNGTEQRTGKLVFFEGLSLGASVIQRGTVLFVMGHVDAKTFMRKSGTYEENFCMIVESWFPRLVDPYRFLNALQAHYPNGIPPEDLQ